MKVHTLLIRTPEGIVFALPLAGPVTRFLAWLVDLFVLLAGSVVLTQVLSLFSWFNPDLIRAAGVLVFFILQTGYAIGCEWLWRGQTIGKRVVGLRVMDVQGLHLQFSQVVIRNLLRFVDGLPALYLVGGAVCFFNSRAQRLGDIAANTIVVRLTQPKEPDLNQLLAGKFNSLRAHAHLAARLRQRVSPAEAQTALQALVRRDTLEPAARVQLFAELATHFRALVEFPPEATEGIADEQFVRNVVDVIFRAGTKGKDASAAAKGDAAALV